MSYSKSFCSLIFFLLVLKCHVCSSDKDNKCDNGKSVDMEVCKPAQNCSTEQMFKKNNDTVMSTTRMCKSNCKEDMKNNVTRKRCCDKEKCNNMVNLKRMKKKISAASFVQPTISAFMILTTSALLLYCSAE